MLSSLVVVCATLISPTIPSPQELLTSFTHRYESMQPYRIEFVRLDPLGRNTEVRGKESVERPLPIALTSIDFPVELPTAHPLDEKIGLFAQQRGIMEYESSLRYRVDYFAIHGRQATGKPNKVVFANETGFVELEPAIDSVGELRPRRQPDPLRLEEMQAKGILATDRWAAPHGFAAMINWASSWLPHATDLQATPIDATRSKLSSAAYGLSIVVVTGKGTLESLEYVDRERRFWRWTFVGDLGQGHPARIIETGGVVKSDSHEVESIGAGSVSIFHSYKQGTVDRERLNHWNQMEFVFDRSKKQVVNKTGIVNEQLTQFRIEKKAPISSEISLPSQK